VRVIQNHKERETFRLTGLRSWRQRNDWTLAELSEATGLSIPHLSRLERGLRNVSLGAAVLISTAVPPEELEAPVGGAE